jgi:dihydroorotate dehydrogenase
MKLVTYIKQTHPHVQVIAGGGVTCKQDAQDYINAGADHVSLGTVNFTPWKLKGILND